MALKKYKVLKESEIDGVEYTPDDTIELEESVAGALISEGKIESASDEESE